MRFELRLGLHLEAITVQWLTGALADGAFERLSGDRLRRELELLCLPGDIPEAIEIDVSDLDIGDAINIEDIPLGENVEISADVNFTVVTVLSPKIEEEEVVEEEEAELEGDEAEEGAEAGETDESSEEK